MVGSGTDELSGGLQIPAFLRHTGPVTNRHFPKQRVLQTIAEVWKLKKSQSIRDKPLSDVLHAYLRSRFGIAQVQMLFIKRDIGSFKSSMP